MTDEDDVTRISEYFKKYDLEEFLVRMLMELGKQAPQDPLEFMHQYAIHCFQFVFLKGVVL